MEIILKISQIKITLHNILEIALWVKCLRNVSTLLLEIFFKKPLFEKDDGNWIDVLPTKTKQYIIRIRYSTKLTPIQASLKKNEGNVCKKLIDKRKKTEVKFQVNDLIRTVDLKRIFSKADTTNRSHKL